ncbi:nuclear transport factor 2 family protein [Desulfosporosinus shakirovi]|uniref:nuclear transport factor 2 family protein n=1 Tax=Desulfosporosinus shakirovi TaxID=2885154 RepID=UPI001E640E5B|nr:nuclear transport factor 2 family protein [Desulfosporosinus sp. SRJS8]MCB8815345.1 nuclear transport factor 2 family protein [Desulfosporosinus sp. SRJS8]
MINNKFQLSKPIEAHFQATNADDPVTFLSIFTDDAVVIDAGKEYHGKTAIKEWSDRDYFGVHLRLEVTNAVQDAAEIVVTAKSDGDYDKSGLPDPLYLDFHFTVEGDKVTRLRNVLSSNGRSIPLPQPIATFYHASDVYDNALLAGCFAADAVLVDEGKEYHGPEAVSGHILEANRDAKVMTEITDCVEKNGDTIVTATLSGNFEGSPIPLDFLFNLENGKIKALNIVLAGE